MIVYLIPIQIIFFRYLNIISNNLNQDLMKIKFQIPKTLETKFIIIAEQRAQTLEKIKEMYHLTA